MGGSEEEDELPLVLAEVGCDCEVGEPAAAAGAAWEARRADEDSERRARVESGLASGLSEWSRLSWLSESSEGAGEFSELIARWEDDEEGRAERS